MPPKKRTFAPYLKSAMANDLRTYQEAKTAFVQLEDNHYWVLGVYGLWGDGLSSRDLTRVLREINFKPSGQVMLTQTLVDRAIRDLAQQQWLSYGSTQWSIEPRYREAVARSLMIGHQKMGERILKALQRTQRLSDYVYTMGSYRRQQSPVTLLRLQYLMQDTRYFFSNYSTILRSAEWNDTWAEYAAEIKEMFLPFDPQWISQLVSPLQARTLEELFFSESFNTINHDRFLSLVLSAEAVGERQAYRLRLLATHLLLQQGPQPLPAELSSAAVNFSEWYGLQAVWSILSNDRTKAVQFFQLFIKSHKEKSLPDNFISIVYLLFQYSEGKQLNAPELYRRLGENKLQVYDLGAAAIDALFVFYLGEEEEAQELLAGLTDDYHLIGPGAVVWLWCCRWIGVNLSNDSMTALLPELQNWEDAGFYWLLGEAANVLAELHYNSDERQRYKVQAAAIAERHNIRQYLGDLFRRQESWERVLKAFERVAIGGNTELMNRQQRIVWLINFEQETILPKEQKMGKNGKWTAGRKIGASKVLTQELDSLTEQDKVLASALRSVYKDTLDRHYPYSDDELRWDFNHALYCLAGHPFVYLEGKQRIPLDIIQAKPQLFINEEEEGLQLRMDPPARRERFVVINETPTRYRVYEFSKDQLALAKAVGSGVHMPTSTTGRLEQLLEQLNGKVTVHSSLALANSDLPKVNGETAPCIHLLPFGEGLKLQFTAKPLPNEPIYFPAGQGIAKQIVQIEEGEVVLSRDLLQEQDEVKAVLEVCPVLAKVPGHDNEWQLEEMQDCLQLLLELRPLKAAGQISIEYPKGEKIRLIAVNSTGDLSMRIQQQRDWFSVEGNLQVDEGRVLEFRQLLAHVKRSKSPFVELKEGEFIALTEEFRQRLEEMEALLQAKGKQFQLSALAAPVMEGLAAELAELEADQAWSDKLDQMRSAQRIRPRVPRDFQTELRSYQKDGFRWLSRLAEWGVGACLADDMGLGKTVQALALLSARASEGPSLVIAPASVARNWMRETERFAPSLLPHLLATSKDTEWVGELGVGDLLVVSYGLLPFVEDVLLAQPFNIVILDEAQAIKNRATKRSKIVMQLQAKFRIATTGTPIENHLGELWNLFRFLNPGLLGSQQNFNEKFAKPIQRDNDDLRREQLRRLIRPFILRRHKSDVLTELPPKTEVTLNVELSPEELAFYESLRREALDEIAAANPNQQRFTVLAQLTRLRQAACHPRLVDKKSRLGSSKLDLVGSTLQELLENGHKVLVFSQFVRHLRIVEQWLQGEGISYQYLDGQTPSKKREVAIQAFQGGEGEVFLISLKAGGTGLNLTAADYVLHLDPWWNPAVEDQASDRAHRIGQQRPVTVYRFVSSQTIEEKIVALHQEKRDLADQLLSGTEASAKLTVEDMLDLITQPMA